MEHTVQGVDRRPLTSADTDVTVEDFRPLGVGPRPGPGVALAARGRMLLVVTRPPGTDEDSQLGGVSQALRDLGLPAGADPRTKNWISDCWT